jgi:hypothetical protein
MADIVLQEDQYEMLENLAALNYDENKIALFFNLPVEDVRAALNDEYCTFYRHYKRGILFWQAKADMQILEQAKLGNITAYQAYKKEAYYQKIEIAKKRIIYKENMEELDRLQTLLSMGKGDGLTPEDEEYYLQLDMVRRMFDKYESKNIIVAALRKSYNLKLNRALQIYSDAINFFYLDNEIKVEAWQNIYADRLDNAALIALEMNDIELYSKILVHAAKLRGVGLPQPDKLPDDFYETRPTLYVIDPKYIGLVKENRNKIAAWIDKLPDISDDDRDRLHQEALDGKSTRPIFNIDANSIDNEE